MENNALYIENLSKKYKNFALENVTFSVPKGSVVGLIGENGAGKSTVIHAALGVIEKDGGTVFINTGIVPEQGMTKRYLENMAKERIGTVFEGSSFPPMMTPSNLDKVFKNIYSEWDGERFFRLLEKFSVPKNVKIKDFSKGMVTKLAIAAAVSHNARLLIMDEATSGLDPVIRDDIIDILLDFIQDENNAVLISSHNTADLERAADYIVFIHNGRVVFEKPKDELIYKYGIIRCGQKQFEMVDRDDMLAYQKAGLSWNILVSDRKAVERKYPGITVDMCTIDEIMTFYIRGKVM